MDTTTEQHILRINIAVLLRCMSHNRPVPCNKLNTVVALREGPVVETHAHITFFNRVRKPLGHVITVLLVLRITASWWLACLAAIHEVPGSIPVYTLEMFLEV